MTKPRSRDELKIVLVDRLQKRLDTGCWEWTGARQEAGYGRVYFGGRLRGVHRVAAHLWLGFDLNSPLLVCHRCDNPRCFNPDHLFIGTQSDNRRDMHRKGRGPAVDPNKAAANLPLPKTGEDNVNAKLTISQVRDIRLLRAAGSTLTRLARDFGVSTSQVGNIVRGEDWRMREAFPIMAAGA